MAIYTLANWSSINLSQFSLDINLDPLGDVLSYEPTVTSFTSTSAKGFMGSWSFSATGTNFTSANPIFNSFTASSGSDFIRLSGSISDFGGTVTSMSMRIGSTEVSFTGNIRLDSNLEPVSFSITSASISIAGYKISFTGSIAIDAFDNASGTVTSFLFEDPDGNRLAASGISLNAALFDDLADPASHSDLSALMGALNFAGNDVIQGGSDTDAMDGKEGNDIYLIASANDHIAAEINDTGFTGVDEIRFSETTLTGI